MDKSTAIADDSYDRDTKIFLTFLWVFIIGFCIFVCFMAGAAAFNIPITRPVSLIDQTIAGGAWLGFVIFCVGTYGIGRGP